MKTNTINRRKFLGYFGSCACGIILPSCTNAPITQRKQLKLIPESTLNRQAADLYERVKAKTKRGAENKINNGDWFDEDVEKEDVIDRQLEGVVNE